MAASPLPLIHRLSRHWWFFLLLVLLFFTPAYTTLPFDPKQTPQLVIAVLSQAIAYSIPALFPLFKLALAAIVIGMAIAPERFSRLFYAWAGVNLLIVAVFQDMAVTGAYGFAVLVGNMIVYGLLGVLWLRAAAGPSARHLTLAVPKLWWRWWVVLPALLAFWYPVSATDGTRTPSFTLLGLLANESGLTFCMILPVYLAVLTLYHPRIDPTVLRVSGFVGAFTGLLNVVEFLLVPMYGPWMAFLHMPLLLISLYAFAISFCVSPELSEAS